MTHLRLKFFSVATVTLLFSLSFAQSTRGTSVENFTSNTLPQAVQDATDETEQLIQQGNEQLAQGELQDAAHTLEQALNLYKELAHPAHLQKETTDEQIKLLSQLVEIYSSLNDFNKTIEYSQSGLAIARKIEDPNTELKFLLTLGDAYNSLGNYHQALESAKTSLNIAQKLQDFQAQATAFNTLASAYKSLASTKSDYQKATQAAMSGLTTAWKVKDSKSEAKALGILSSVYSSLRENSAAIAFAKRALKVAQTNKISTVAASSTLTLAGIQLEEGDYQQVIELTRQGRYYLKELKQNDSDSAALVAQSLGYFGQGNSKKSLELAEQGLTNAQATKSPLMEALALTVLSLSYSDIGDSQKAIELINQSRTIAQEQNNKDLEALSLEVLGEIYRTSKQEQDAIAAYQKSISIRDTYSAQARLARLYQDLGQLGTATIYYKQAINEYERNATIKIDGLPSWLQISFPKTIQEVNGVPTASMYRSLAKLLLVQKRLPEAQQVLELMKEQELRAYSESEFSDNTADSPQPATLTLMPVEQRIVQDYGSLIAFGYQLDECQRTQCPQLEQLLQKRSLLTEHYQDVLKHLETKVRDNRIYDEAFVDPGQFAQKAQKIVESQPNTVLIYPLVLDDQIWLLWSSKGGILKSVEVTGVSQAQLEVTVLQFRQLLQNRLSNIDELQATGKQLYDWLIKPLEGELKENNIHNLIFSLDRSTRYIPMSALFDGEKYLIENYTVSTIVSTQFTPTSPQPNTLEEEDAQNSVTVGTRNVSEPVASLTLKHSLMTQQPPSVSPSPTSSEPSILALGVSKAVAGFRPLPFVTPELDAIVRQDPEGSSGIYPGQKFLDEDFDFFALRDNVYNHQILHIATHGEFLPGRANQSYLLLGTGQWLAIPDIETWLNLQRIDLVVLSACETALGGPGLNGREVAGIGYYFLKGGARTVVASLWNVDERSTFLLMQEFYHNLAQSTLTSPVTKAEALRQAQLALIKGSELDDQSPITLAPNSMRSQTRPNQPLQSTLDKSRFTHPFYWSSFIIMGSGL
ncbi:MAG TPA: CHAT domain-containing protein [Cyanophyceae cyanobacterium]